MYPVLSTSWSLRVAGSPPPMLSLTRGGGSLRRGRSATTLKMNPEVSNGYGNFTSFSNKNFE